MSVLKKNFTFVDLFAGIGGFRIAMEQFSPESICLYASEIDKAAIETYTKNFRHNPNKDIEIKDIKEIDPIKQNLRSPDVVCGGFPCQTFSKSGKQAGLKDERGVLFREITRIINSYKTNDKPKILILENVQNLVSHNEQKTWKTIREELSESGYNVIKKPLILSPKDVGVPQTRKRAIILAVIQDICNEEIIIKKENITKENRNSIKDILIKKLSKDDMEKTKIDEDKIFILNCWNELIKELLLKNEKLGFPIWIEEFGQTYDLSNMPIWKQKIVNKNRNFYLKNKTLIDNWMKKWHIRENKIFTKTLRKFEWQAGSEFNDIFEGLIQFRPSGIRVKRLSEAPTLVAINHRLIYGPEKRYITVREAARLQSFPDTYKFYGTENKTLKQLGNAVNVEVIKTAFKAFIEFIDLKTGDKHDKRN